MSNDGRRVGLLSAEWVAVWFGAHVHSHLHVELELDVGGVEDVKARMFGNWQLMEGRLSHQGLVWRWVVEKLRS